MTRVASFRQWEETDVVVMGKNGPRPLANKHIANKQGRPLCKQQALGTMTWWPVRGIPTCSKCKSAAFKAWDDMADDSRVVYPRGSW